MVILTLAESDTSEQLIGVHQLPVVHFTNVDPSFESWMNEARKRIFSIAAGNRVGKMAPKIMEVGFGKILFAANQLGHDIEQSNSYVFFAPDGTVTYNPVRIKRGFTYGAILNFNFEGLLATNNSLPNGCGFSVYELEDPKPDAEMVMDLERAQMKIGENRMSQLGKGNHFAGVYYVNDPASGEDTNRRFVVVHCSGHVGGTKLYHPQSWLSDTDGYYEVPTPHGEMILLEGDARKQYVDAYEETNTANAVNRDKVMYEVFGSSWKTLEEVTHQGLEPGTGRHIIGTQIHKGLVPIAFNPEEGLVMAKTLPNLSASYLDTWENRDRMESLDLYQEFRNLNFCPHGSGYEFRNPIKDLEANLGPEGIHNFTIQSEGEKTTFEYFREIRHLMTFRRKAQILKEIFKAEIAEIVFELPGLKQIYPLKSIPGGSH